MRFSIPLFNMQNILIFFLILLVINTIIVMWPYTFDAMLMMYFDGISPFCGPGKF